MECGINIEKEIAKTDEFRSICESNNYISALKKIDYLSKKYAKHHNLNKTYAESISDILSMMYIIDREKRETQNKHFFEDFYIKTHNILKSEVLLTWLIKKCQDFRYIGIDQNGNSLPFADLLAVKTKSKSIMKYVIKKVLCTGKSEYSINDGREKTDICRMCIISGELDDALQIFNSYIYKIKPASINTNTISFNINDNCNPKVIKLITPVNNVNESDTLYGILESLREADLKLEEKELFLEKIICNEKIKVFNTACFSLIEDIVGTDYYRHFKEYILTKVETNEIILYEVNKNEKNEYSIMFISLETYKYKRKQKVLTLNQKKYAQA